MPPNNCAVLLLAFFGAACASSDQDRATEAPREASIAVPAPDEPFVVPDSVALGTADALHWPADQWALQLGTANDDALRRLVPECAGDALLSSAGIGPVRASHTVAEVLSSCPVVLPYFHIEEGIPVPALAVRLNGAIVRIELIDSLRSSRISRLMSDDSTVQTREGVGPRKTLGDLEAAYGPLKFDTAECAIYVWSERLRGVSWILAFPVGWDCIRADSTGMPGGPIPSPTTRLFRAIVFEPRAGR